MWSSSPSLCPCVTNIYDSPVTLLGQTSRWTTQERCKRSFVYLTISVHHSRSWWHPCMVFKDRSPHFLPSTGHTIQPISYLCRGPRSMESRIHNPHPESHPRGCCLRLQANFHYSGLIQNHGKNHSSVLYLPGIPLSTIQPWSHWPVRIPPHWVNNRRAHYLTPYNNFHAHYFYLCSCFGLRF